MFRINLGGEGEVPGVLNQQPRWMLTEVANPYWQSSALHKSWADLIAEGHAFLFCDNAAIALPDECVDEVITNSVPVNKSTYRGPGVQSSEIVHILKPGGMWFRDGNLHYVKP